MTVPGRQLNESTTVDARRLSVIIASYNARGTVEECLGSLEAQDCAGSFEVIVVDSSEDGTGEAIARRFPGVELLRCEGRRFPGDARNLGVAKARGEIFAFIDADCVAAPDWVRAILSAHDGWSGDEYPVIGGAVDNANPQSSVGWASYFCEFSAWIPPAPASPEWSGRRMVDIPTCCLSMKRWSYDRYGPFIAGTYCSDTAFNWRAGRAGHGPLYIPAIRVSHVNLTGLATFMRKRLWHGRAFARVRVREQKFSALRRLLYIALSPALPLFLFGRVARHVVVKQSRRGQFLRVAPLVAVGMLAWACGEVVGYLPEIPRGRVGGEYASRFGDS